MKMTFKLEVDCRDDIHPTIHALALQAVLDMRLQELDIGISGPVRVTVPRQRKPANK